MNKPVFSLKPTQILVLGYLVMIIIGGLTLSLPISSASREFTPLLDALFTSASACCVTGLTVVNTSAHWSLFGKAVILLLIQIGGLGFITLMTIAFIIAGRRITLKERVVIQESLNITMHNGIVRFVKFLAQFTLAIELGGAVVLALRFMADYSIPKAIGMGIFHSISAFCNAGFDIIGSSSMVPYNEDILINFVIMFLIITGGLGFPVWIELLKLVREYKKDNFTLAKKIKRLSLHTKLVLISTVVLILSGAIFTFLFEYNNPNTLGMLSFKGKVLASFFHSVALRTAGFFSIDYSSINHSTEFISVAYMMVGGSPCGTAGGIKTMSVTVILLAVISLIKDKENITAFKRTISFKLLQKALTVTILMLTILLGVTTLLSITETGMAIEYEFLDLLFEVASALGTVGSTVGITPHLSVLGKIIIMVCMYIGRLGPITIAISFIIGSKDKNKIHYPPEDILIG